MVCLSCGRRLGVPLQVPPGAQGASLVASGKSSLYLSCEGRCGSTLESRQGNQDSICMEGGISRCFSSCAGSVGYLALPRGPEGASHVVSGKSGILSSCEGPLGIPLELVQWIRASSHVEVESLGSSPALIGISGFLWRFHWGFSHRFLLGHGTPLPSQGGKGVSGLLLS